MKPWMAVGCVSMVAVLSTGCNPTSRYKVLSFFFDAVPAPVAPEVPQAPSGAVAPRSEAVRYREHGPYAAKLCNVCHDPSAFNTLVAPPEQLCLRCHSIPLNKKYIHGPLASGGCLACHDPHSSQYEYLLVSAPSTFCFYCHDRAAITRQPVHAAVEGQPCTNCHDAHMSDNRFLLRSHGDQGATGG